MEERKQTVITEYRLTEISYINHYNNRFYSKKVVRYTPVLTPLNMNIVSTSLNNTPIR